MVCDIVDGNCTQGVKPSEFELEEREAAAKRMTLDEFQKVLNTNAYRSRHVPWLKFVDFGACGNVPNDANKSKPSGVPEILKLEQTNAYSDLVRVDDVLGSHYRSPPGQPLPTIITELRLKMDHLLVAAFLLENGVTDKYTHLRQATKEKSYPFLSLCFCYGLDLNDHYIFRRPKPLAETFHDEQMTRWFLDHGADPNADRNGETSLSVAVRDAPFNTIKLLFDRGGPDSIRKGDLLWYAVHRQLPDYMQVLEYLLAKGATADLNKLASHDRPDLAYYEDMLLGRGTPLHSAARSGRLDVVKLLVSYGADPKVWTSPTTVRVSKRRLPIDEARKELRYKERTGDFEGIIAFLEPLSQPIVDQQELSFVGLERL